MARDHLWLHFTRMGELYRGRVPIIVRGDGCYVDDARGSATSTARGPVRRADRLLVRRRDGRGGGRPDARAAVLHELVVRPPGAIELADEVASLAPEGMDKVFFASGGSEAESAWKLARQYHALRGERRWKAITRNGAYHGTTMGALSLTGIPRYGRSSSRSSPTRSTSTTRTATAGRRRDRGGVHGVPPRRPRAPDPTRPGPETVAMVIMEPVQNAGGAFTPPAGYFAGVREICDRYGILLCADEVITGFGRLGAWFGSELYDIRPDLVTGARASPRRTRRSARWSRAKLVCAVPRARDVHHGITFGGHPPSARSRSEHRDHEARGDHRARREHEDELPRRRSRSCSTSRSSATCAARVLLRARAGQGPGDAGDVHRRGVRVLLAASLARLRSEG